MTKRAKSRIPEFKNRQEMAKWWDKHNLADYQDEFKTIKANISKNLTSTLNVRLDPNSLDKIRQEAYKKGVGPTTLARMWILEHIQ